MTLSFAYGWKAAKTKRVPDRPLKAWERDALNAFAGFVLGYIVFNLRLWISLTY